MKIKSYQRHNVRYLCLILSSSFLILFSSFHLSTTQKEKINFVLDAPKNFNFLPCFLVQNQLTLPRILNLTDFELVSTNKEDNEDNEVTVVTSFFALGSKSKHSIDKYKKWISYFFTYTKGPVVVFSDLASHSIIEKVSHNNTKIIILDLWDIPITIGCKDFFRMQRTKDKEKSIHSPELYVLWNSKSWMVAAVSKWNPYSSSFFLWTDIGSFRERKTFHNFPSTSRLAEIFHGGRADRILFGVIQPFTDKDIKNYDIEQGPFVSGLPGHSIGNGVIEGGFFGGNQQSMISFFQNFTNLFWNFASANFFVGKDQEIYASYALLHSQSAMFLRTDLFECGDPWFVFQYFLANQSEIPSPCALDLSKVLFFR